MTERKPNGLKKEVEEAIEKKLSRSSGSKSPEDFDSYHDWVSYCMKEKGGGSDSMSKCAKEWKGEDTAEGTSEDRTKQQPKDTYTDKDTIKDKDKDKDEGGVHNDVLVVTEGCPSCKKLQKVLMNPIMSKDVKLVGAKSSVGQNIIAQMPEDETLSIPFHAIEQEMGYVKGDLEKLLNRYAG